MNKEPIIQDKIHLLMEETGCDQAEAELAMALAGYDLEKAIRTIGVLLRNIVVLKGKWLVPSKNLYGLLMVLVDTKRQNVLRVRAVVSYNPALYETAWGDDWYDFEKTLYAFRLLEGTLQQMTRGVEHHLSGWLEVEGGSVLGLLREPNVDPLGGMIRPVLGSFFSDGNVTLELARQEFNLEQFRHFKPRGDNAAPVTGEGRSAAPAPGESLLLSVDLQQDAEGVPAREVKTGDSVFALLTDGRDIAQYLSRLLGGRSDTGVKPLAVPVEEVRLEGNVARFQMRLSIGILGYAETGADSLLRVQRRSASRWWRRLIPF